jgi:hypothetical protein
MTMKRLLAIIGAFVIGGLTVAITAFGPQAAEAGLKFN